MPGVIADGTSEYRCPRCRNILRQSDLQLRIGIDDHPPSEEDTPAEVEAPTEDATVVSTDVDREPEVHSPPVYDGWELEQRLKHIERVLADEDRAFDERPAEKSSRFVRIDAAHGSLGRPHDRSAAGVLSRPGTLMRIVAWSSLLIGVTMLACGTFLMGWSMFSSRAALWSIGSPIALVGAISLFVALVVQIDRLLHVNRDTAAKLDIVDTQLGKLTAATSHLGNHRHSPSDAFYSHLAGGANPQLLLTDLKSQLDMLADQIGQR